MIKLLLLTLSTFNFITESVCQSDFEKVWTNPDYDSTLALADSTFKNGDFISAESYFKDAFEIRPTTYSNRMKSLSKCIHYQCVDSMLTISENLYNSVIYVADSLLVTNSECDAFKLYYIAKILSTDCYPDEMIHQIHHPIHGEELDVMYFKLVKKADEYYLHGNFEKAKLLYERAVLFNKHDPYPRNQLKKMNE